MKIISLFSGCGGLDLGFTKAGYDIILANEFDKTIWETYERNHDIELIKKNIVDIKSDYFPYCDGIIGGPPCQSWSNGGNRLGIEDDRGKLFYEYIRILNYIKPKFFLVENVKGILSSRHKKSFFSILESFDECGYDVFYKLLNSNNYNVPQLRQRVIFIGIRKDINKKFIFKEHHKYHPILKDCIWDIKEDAKDYKDKSCCNIPNHEYLNSKPSMIFLWGNRVEKWDKPSRTIPCSVKFIPYHPDCPEMVKCETYPNPRHYRLMEGKEYLYRRLSVRECARIQTFSDDFIFYYKDIKDGYKMVGNAVPVEMARILACEIKELLK